MKHGRLEILHCLYPFCFLSCYLVLYLFDNMQDLACKWNRESIIRYSLRVVIALRGSTGVTIKAPATT